LIGIVTKFDFLRAFAFTSGQMVPHYDALMRRTVAEMMSEAVVHVEPTTSLTRVLQLMVSRMTRSLPVMSPDRRLVGMISRGRHAGVARGDPGVDSARFPFRFAGHARGAYRRQNPGMT
jgi:CBS-domain-containing membrane protein